MLGLEDRVGFRSVEIAGMGCQGRRTAGTRPGGIEALSWLKEKQNNSAGWEHRIHGRQQQEIKLETWLRSMQEGL